MIVEYNEIVEEESTLFIEVNEQSSSCRWPASNLTDIWISIYHSPKWRIKVNEYELNKLVHNLNCVADIVVHSCNTVKLLLFLYLKKLAMSAYVQISKQIAKDLKYLLFAVVAFCVFVLFYFEANWNLNCAVQKKNFNALSRIKADKWTQ